MSEEFASWCTSTRAHFMLKIQHAQQARPRDRGRHCAFSRAQRAMLLASRLAPGVCFDVCCAATALLRYFGRHRGEADDAGAGRDMSCRPFLLQFVSLV